MPELRKDPVGGTLDRLARRRGSWALVLAVALASRLAFALTAPMQISWVDGRSYEEAGWRLATEGRFTGGPIMAPGYPAFIAAVYKLTGRDLVSLRVAEALLSTVTVGAIGAFGVALFAPGAGLVAAGLAATHPVLAMLPATQYSETVTLFLLTFGLGALALALRRPRALLFALAGLATGLAILCKPTVAGVLPGFALGAAWRLRAAGPGRIVLWAAAFTVVAACVTGAWMARNHAVHGRWFLTTKAGQQLWLGNNPDYRGETTRNPRPAGAMLDSLGAAPDAFAKERVFRREALRFMREQPGRAAYLYLLKVRNVLALYPVTQTHTGYSQAAGAVAQGLSSLAIYVGVALGLARLLSLGFAAFPLAVASYVMIGALYLTVMRYRMGVEVLLLWMAGLGWWWWLEGRRASSPALGERVALDG